MVLVVSFSLDGLHPKTNVFLKVSVQHLEVTDRHLLTTPTFPSARVPVIERCWKGGLARRKTITKTIAFVRQECAQVGDMRRVVPLLASIRAELGTYRDHPSTFYFIPHALAKV